MTTPSEELKPCQNRLSRDADIILEALNTYDQFMVDDDYDYHRVLDKIIGRMRERYNMVDRTRADSHLSEQPKTLREGTLEWDAVKTFGETDQKPSELWAAVKSQRQTIDGLEDQLAETRKETLEWEQKLLDEISDYKEQISALTEQNRMLEEALTDLDNMWSVDRPDGPETKARPGFPELHFTTKAVWRKIRAALSNTKNPQE